MSQSQPKSSILGSQLHSSCPKLLKRSINSHKMASIVSYIAPPLKNNMKIVELRIHIPQKKWKNIIYHIITMMDHILKIHQFPYTGWGFQPLLKNMSQLGLLFPRYGKIKFMFQTNNQYENSIHMLNY